MASKNMRLRKKIERAKLSKSYSRNATDLSVIYEIKLNKLRANNRSLAKALADQKQETKLWYNEVISLKGQLQEAQERLAETRDNGFEGAVETEVLRRIQEHSEPLNTAMNAAMENMVVVIDNFTKVKQLVGTLTRGVRNRSTSYLGSSSSSKVSLPKSSGPREPMKSNSGQVTLSSNVSVSASGNNWTSTRYHRVLPMVEGHTLQPAMVAIPKVDIQELWKRKQEERAQVNQEGDMAISVIEEQNSSLEMSRPDSTYNQQQDEENLDESESADDTRNTSDASDALPSSADPSTHELPFEELSPTRYQDNIFGDEFSRSYNANNFPSAKQKENAEARCKEDNLGSSPEESQEDPLEGPSWRFINIEKPVSKSGRRKSSVAARKSSPGKRRRSSARIGGQKSSRRGRRSNVRSVLQDTGSNANDSHVSETETSLVNNVSSGDGAVADELNSGCLPSQNANDSVATANGGPEGDLIQENIQDSSEGLMKDAPLNVGDASYLASPATMLARLEELEAKRGRKSRSRSTRSSGNIPRVLKYPSEVGSPTVKLRRLSSEEIHSSMFMKERLSDDALPINGSDNYGVSETDSALPLPPPLACSQNLASLPCDYLITDQDLTCVMDVTMEMTEPVSKLIPQISQEPVNTDEKATKPVKEVTENKKFFKPRTKEVQENSRTSSKDSENAIKTPFDLSLMESTMVMPPYVSTKSEKENIHPSMTNILDDDVKEGRKSLKMVNVSVVLEDVMRTPKLSEHLQSHMQSLSSKELPGNSKVILESPRERKKKGPSPEKASKKSLNSSMELIEDDVDWIPPMKKGQKNVKGEDAKSASRKRTSKSSKLSIGASEVAKKKPRKSKAAINITPEREPISEMSNDKINSSVTKDEVGKEALSPPKEASSPKKKYKAAAVSTKNQEEKNAHRNENVTKFAKPAKPRGRPPGNRKKSKASRSITPKPSPEVTPNTTPEVSPNVLLESSVQNEESLPIESKPADLKVKRTPVKRPKVRSKPRIGVGKPKKRKPKKSNLPLTNGVDESLVELLDLSSPDVSPKLNSTEPQNSNIGMEDALLDLNNEVVDTSVDKSLDQKPEDMQKDKKLSIENKNNMCQSSEPPKSSPLLDVKKEFGDDLESLFRKLKQVTDSDKDLEDGETLPDLGAITFSEEEDKNKNSNQRKNLMTGIEAINSLNALECAEELADQGLKKDEEKNRILEAKKSIDVADLKIEVEEEGREHRRRRTTAITSYKEIPLNCKMRQGKENSVSISMKSQVSKSKS